MKVDSETGEAGAAAGKALEARLNKYDKAVQAIDPKSKIAIQDGKGQKVGEVTGKQFTSAWNHQKFSITSMPSNNGGYGGTVPGRTSLQVNAVGVYSAAAVARGLGSVDKITSLTDRPIMP